MDLQELALKSGYKDFESLKFLRNLAHPMHTIVELGTKYGCSAFHMAEGSRATIYTVDMGSIMLPHLRIITIRCDTRACTAALKKVMNTSADMAFMDACHLKADMEHEYSCLRLVLGPEHILVVDDVNCNDVAEFVQSLPYQYRMYFPYHQGMAVLTNEAESVKGVARAMP